MKKIIHKLLTTRSPKRLNLTVMLVLCAVISFQLTQVILAQQPVVPVPVAGAAYSLSSSITTQTAASGSTAIRVAPQGDAVISIPTGITGTRSIFGWVINGPAQIANSMNCFLQIYDAGPTTAYVTPGTTAIVTSLAMMNTAGSQQPFISPVPLFSITSTLQVFGATTPSGATACATPITVTFFYK